MAECLYSALKIIAVWIPNVAVPRPATNTAAWWIFVNGEKSMGTAKCQESSKIEGLCPPPPTPNPQCSPILGPWQFETWDFQGGPLPKFYPMTKILYKLLPPSPLPPPLCTSSSSSPWQCVYVSGMGG